ncbi:MAG: SWIM zinc finger family protein [Erysipelotrichaceae bacterium]|nr:SWIM zinc finger family protein [Erysipelotrichaceae bacterium]MDY5251201.1 SWIM zinc finger family protein [Erysipelotrichaceae bacterium]
MKRWKGLFREIILERGRDYFYGGMVTEFQKTDSGYRAVVMGTEEYEVEIEIDKDRVNDMSCSCPYAEDGNYCKHMAAVLYKIEKENETNNELKENWFDPGLGSEKELIETIAKMSEDELRNLVKSLADRDNLIKNMIITRYALTIDENQLKRLKSEVDDIVGHYEDRSGFINYRNAWDFTIALQDFLEEKVSMLIERRYYAFAFKLTNYVFKTIGNIDIDDSDGGISMIANVCYEKWKKILENCDNAEKNKMFSWFMHHHGNGYVIDYMEDYIKDFLMNEFQDQEMLKKKLKFLDELIEKQKSYMDDSSSWNVCYEYQDNILKRLEIMEKLSYPKEEISEYKKKNWRLSAVRCLEIQANLECGNIDQAVNILKESKILDSDHAGLIAQYSKDLIDIYEKQADDQSFKNELLFYVFECSQNNLVYINKLKAICTAEEWKQYRNQILENPKNYYIQYPLMEAEGMYERMLEIIKRKLIIYRLDEYEKVLKEKFPEQVRNIYILYLHEEAKRASDRNSYRELMRYLQKIKGYPEGKEKAKEIADKWRMMYHRRSAMMDELRKAGF